MTKKNSATQWTSLNSQGFPTPAALAVDVVVLTIDDEVGAVRLLALKQPRARYSLIGGFIGQGESAEGAVRRVLFEKAGISELGLEQLAAFTEPDRDPRGWIPTIAYLALVQMDNVEIAGEISWIERDDWRKLVYDHETIALAGLDRVRGKLWWSNVVAKVVPAEFAMTETRKVYEGFAGRSYDPSTFSRDLLATGLVESTGAVRRTKRGRPATLYRFVSDEPTWGAGRRKRVTP